jgi:diacylglycerol kinase (ATP)
LQRLRSFSFAWAGLRYLIASEHNARVHLAATVAVVTSAILLRADTTQCLFLVVAVGWVWFAEAMNTAVERLADAVTLEHHPQIRIAKDVASAAVLIASIVSAITGLAIFVPLILRLMYP